MLYKVRKSFTGSISAHGGQTLDIEDEVIIKDLLKAGYIEEIEGVEKSAPSTTGTDKKKK